MLLSFKGAGLSVPNFQVTYAEQVCVGLEAYFSALIPFMRDGHVSQVDTMADSAAHRAEGVAVSFDPKRWFHEQT